MNPRGLTEYTLKISLLPKITILNHPGYYLLVEYGMNRYIAYSTSVKMNESVMKNTLLPRFNIVLVEPEIPPNTGSIARLCGATNCTLHLIHPLGFSIDDKQVKRAGLDYWNFVDIINWHSFDQFAAENDEQNFKLFTTKVTTPYTEAHFNPGDFLIFGKETKGLSTEIRELYGDLCFTLPMANSNIRSLNLAMTAGIVLYEAIRQQSDPPA